MKDNFQNIKSVSRPALADTGKSIMNNSSDSITLRLPTILQELVIDTIGETCFGRWPSFNEIKNYMVQRNICAIWRALDDSFMEFPCLSEQLVVCNPNMGIADTELTQLEQWLSSV